MVLYRLRQISITFLAGLASWRMSTSSNSSPRRALKLLMKPFVKGLPGRVVGYFRCSCGNHSCTVSAKNSGPSSGGIPRKRREELTGPRGCRHNDGFQFSTDPNGSPCVSGPIHAFRFLAPATRRSRKRRTASRSAVGSGGGRIDAQHRRWLERASLTSVGSILWPGVESNINVLPHLGLNGALSSLHRKMNGSTSDGFMLAREIIS